MSKTIRVALIGVGNCANSFLQGLNYYGAQNVEVPLGLVRPTVGGYGVKDIAVVAAFDCVAGKVGQPLPLAAWAKPNDTFRFADIVASPTTPMVQRGPTLDGLGKYLSEWVTADPSEPVDVAAVLRERRVDVVINYLPVGSQAATEFYATAALQAKCALVNCIPVFLASAPDWSQRFRAAGLPIIGDDVKSQVGATIVHRALASLFRDRGVHLDRTYQLNIGGNGDFANMLERERLLSKKRSKTEAVIAVSGINFEDKDIHVGPSDYVEWLGDRKFAFIRMEGRGFGGAPLLLEVKMEVWDSPNSAGVVIDAVRCAQVALDRGWHGPVTAPSAYFMKRPPQQMNDCVALELLQRWLDQEPTLVAAK